MEFGGALVEFNPREVASRGHSWCREGRRGGEERGLRAMVSDLGADRISVNVSCLSSNTDHGSISFDLV